MRLTETCIATKCGNVHTEWDDISGPRGLTVALPCSFRWPLRRCDIGVHIAASSSVDFNFLVHHIGMFAEALGTAVNELCPRPGGLTDSDAEAQALVEGSNEAVLQRAFSGTTISAAALIDGEKNNLWVVGVGDSSAVLSSVSPDGIRKNERLITLHNGRTPTEYPRITLNHPSSEQHVMKDNCALGGLTVTRAIGDFGSKFPSGFSRQIFHRYYPHLSIPLLGLESPTKTTSRRTSRREARMASRPSPSFSVPKGKTV
ncbi:putative protein serine threonine phosphatase 2C [Lyophyllum shimeji]|uniref:PPM-type phosphatase domain-containing protein n=1 Tax=Lyophyllum shimeji TaxID=47721 RepID=A0A9P3PNB6_LYOSH|nr:putative protein serine threonine phosphatase 2C [Lyophyllum shimeji]